MPSVNIHEARIGRAFRGVMCGLLLALAACPSDTSSTDTSSDTVATDATATMDTVMSDASDVAPAFDASDITSPADAQDAPVPADAPDGSIPSDGSGGTDATDATSGIDAQDASSFDDIVVHGSGLTAYDGLVFHLALYDSSIGTVTRTATVTAAGGTFTVTWSAAFNRNLFGMQLLVYVDRNHDGACTAADTTWSQFIDNTFMPGTVGVDFSATDGGMAGSTASCTHFH
jgi:hypothetical protein